MLILLKNPPFSKISKNVTLDYQGLANEQNTENGVFKQNQMLRCDPDSSANQRRQMFL
jgi:hypothetical protein